MKQDGGRRGRALSYSKLALLALLVGSGAAAGAGIASANVARPSPRPDSIVGSWVGQAAQPDQDPFDVRLTFVSPRGGVSRYPGDPACGGVLTGDLDGDHYQYSETITYGSFEEVDQGCLNGKLKLTVEGDTMKLDWTSVNADGEQMSASGELRRQGGTRKN